MNRLIAIALLFPLALAAQHVRTKSLPTADFAAIRGVAFRPGLIHGFHPKIDEPLLRRNVEARILERAAAVGLPQVPGSPVRLTYSLTVREDLRVVRRGATRAPRETTEYRLEIRLVDPAGTELWTATATGEVEERRHRYVEERVLRAVTFAMAKYPPAQRPAAQ